MRWSAFALGCLALATKAEAQNAPYLMDNPTYTMPPGPTAQAVLTQSGYLDSNPLLLTEGERTLWGSITSPELVVGNKTPLSSINSDTVFSSNNFNQSDFDSNDIHSKLAFSEQLQRWSAGFQGNVDYDTTRTSEFSSYNNLSSTPVRHLGETLSPQIGYNFLPTDKLGLTGSYSESQYGSKTFTNYNVYSVTPSYTHNFDPLDAGVLTLQAQRYTALNNVKNITDTVGPSISWRKIFTERLNGSISFGFQETRQKTFSTPAPSWTPQYNYSGALSYKGKQDVLSVGASRSQYPFGNGTEALLTQFSVNETHSLNNLFSVGVVGSYQMADYPSSAAGNLKSLAAGGGGLTYHATKYLDIAATYNYQHETLVGISKDAQKNIGMLSLTYHPTAWTL